MNKREMRERAIKAVSDLESRFSDPSVEQYADAVLAAISADRGDRMTYKPNHSLTDEQRGALAKVLSDHRWYDYECTCQGHLPDNEIVPIDRADHDRHVLDVLSDAVVRLLGDAAHGGAA